MRICCHHTLYFKGGLHCQLHAALDHISNDPKLLLSCNTKIMPVWDTLLLACLWPCNALARSIIKTARLRHVPARNKVSPQNFKGYRGPVSTGMLSEDIRSSPCSMSDSSSTSSSSSMMQGRRPFSTSPGSSFSLSHIAARSPRQ